MRILIAKDELRIASFVEKGLRAAGYCSDEDLLSLLLPDAYRDLDEAGRAFVQEGVNSLVDAALRIQEGRRRLERPR